MTDKLLSLRVEANNILYDALSDLDKFENVNPKILQIIDRAYELSKTDTVNKILNGKTLGGSK